MVCEKRFPRELLYTMDSNSCILMNGNFFLWTSKNTFLKFCRYKMKVEQDSGLQMKKSKDFC